MKSSLTAIVHRGVRSTWCKYIGNASEIWEKIYSDDYAEKLDGRQQRPRNEAIAEMIRTADIPNARLLDLGCGAAALFDLLKDGGVQYHGVDFSQEAIRLAEKRIGKNTHHRLWVSDLESFAPEEKYDVVVLNEVLYYFPLSNAANVMRKALSLLKNEQSRLIISMSDNPKSSLIWKSCEALVPYVRELSPRGPYPTLRWTVREYRQT